MCFWQTKARIQVCKKNQKYFKNYFVKESTSASPSTTCNFCGRGGHISSTCPLRNGSQKNSNAKAKKVWIKKFKVTNPQGLKKIWVRKSTWVLYCRFQRRISGSWIVDAQDTWPEMNQVCFPYKEKERICYLWRQCKRKNHWSRQHW